jgi:hypothetical protein
LRLNKGAVFNHLNIEFKDGEHGNKYLIILNNQQGEDPYLCCKTTSKQQYGIDNPGCHFEKGIFVLDLKKPPFPKKTWVQFDANGIFEYEAVELLQCKFRGEIILNAELDSTLVQGIVNCFKKSQDISDYHLELINKGIPPQSPSAV